jgi:threonine dehydrogenase-like Zn-dependent dehydrogenase
LGADVVIEAAGRAQTAAEVFRLAGRAGRILYFGVVPPGQKVEVEPNDIFKRELSVYGSAINPYTHHRVVSLLKRLDVGCLVTHSFPLDQINEAMQAAREARGLKICIKPNL